MKPLDRARGIFAISVGIWTTGMSVFLLFIHENIVYQLKPFYYLALFIGIDRLLFAINYCAKAREEKKSKQEQKD